MNKCIRLHLLSKKQKNFFKFDFLCPYLNNKSLFNLFIHIEDGYSGDK